MKVVLKTGRDARNTMSDAELEKKKKELMESPIFKQAQQAAKDVTERIQKVADTLKPVLDRVAQARHQVSTSIFDQERVFTAIAPRENTQYAILKELRILNQKKPMQKQVTTSEVVITYDTRENILMRIVDGKEYTYHFKNDAKRKKLFDTLRLKKSYLQRKELKVVLGSPTADAVSTMIKTFNDKVALKLKLKIRFIVAKAGSGYRINPSVIIERA